MSIAIDPRGGMQNRPAASPSAAPGASPGSGSLFDDLLTQAWSRTAGFLGEVGRSVPGGAAATTGTADVFNQDGLFRGTIAGVAAMPPTGSMPRNEPEAATDDRLTRSIGVGSRAEAGSVDRALREPPPALRVAEASFQPDAASARPLPPADLGGVNPSRPASAAISLARHLPVDRAAPIANLPPATAIVDADTVGSPPERAATPRTAAGAAAASNVAASLQTIDEGLGVVARLADLTPHEDTVLRGRIAALFARHGLTAPTVRLNGGGRLPPQSAIDRRAADDLRHLSGKER